MTIVEPFERHSVEYDRWFAENRLAYRSELAALRSFIPIHGRGIELGVGSGRFAAPLGIGIGVDPSAKMRDMAKSRGLEVCGGVAEAVPFRDASFDCALMVTTLCFLDDLAAAFREAHRITRAAGILVLGLIDKDSPLGESYRHGREKSTFYATATFRSVGEIVSQLKDAGFSSFSFVQTIFRDPEQIDDLEPVKAGYGEGLFVAVRAAK